MIGGLNDCSFGRFKLISSMLTIQQHKCYILVCILVHKIAAIYFILKIISHVNNNESMCSPTILTEKFKELLFSISGSIDLVQKGISVPCRIRI